MKGVIEKVADFMIYVLVFVWVIFSLVYVANGTPMAQNECIRQQSGIINDLKNQMSEASTKNTNIPYSFEVLNCVKCMWYDTNFDQLMVVYSVRRNFLSHEELMTANYSVPTNFADIGCDCSSCDENNGATPPDYCANLRGDIHSPYLLQINKTHIACLSCPANSPTTRKCPIETYTNCGCPSGLCKELNCGDLINVSLSYVGEKYFKYSLTSPKNIEIKLITDNGNYFNLSAMWTGNSCPASDAMWNCVQGITSTQTCNNNLQAGTYYVKIRHYGFVLMNYNLSLTCT